MRQKCLFFFVLMCLFVGLSGCDRGGKSRSGNDANREVSSSSSSSGSSDESGSDAFRMLLDIKETDLEISFYVKGDNDINIDWGDGNRNTVYGGNGEVVEHTYPSSGTHEVSITGLNQMGFFNDESGDFNPLESCGEKLREVKSWGGVEWDSTDFMFYGCSNLTTLPSEAPYLSNVENMSGMFYGATNFNQDISDWDVSNVDTMLSMFEDATNFNQDISGWNVSNVVTMFNMFAGATNFDQPLNHWGEHIDKVFEMSGMFYEATKFDHPLNDWGGHLYNVLDMSDMFWGAEKFAQSLDDWALLEDVVLDDFIHKNSTYVKNNDLPQFCRDRPKEDSKESVCLSDKIYTPKESETAQSPELAEDE